MRAFLLERFPADPAVARLKPERLAETCGACGGAGQCAVACASCQGGICRTCNGTGKRTAPGLNGPRELRCTTCGGFGKCRACAGSGSVSGPCKDCGGSGRKDLPSSVEREYKELLAAMAGQGGSAGGQTDAAPDKTPANKQPPPGATWTNMSDFVSSVQSLRRIYQAGGGKEADLLDVIAKQNSLKGQVLIVKGFLLAHHQKAVKLGAESDPNSAVTIELTPDTINVGADAAWALQVEGNPVPVRATFGFLRNGQAVLFALPLDRPKGGP